MLLTFLTKIKNNLEVDFYEQWSAFWKGANWYDFTIINISFEDEANMGNFEITLSLLGFTLYIRYCYDNEMFEEKIEEYKDFITSIKK